LSKKRNNHAGDRLGLLEEDHMTGVGNVRHVDAAPKSFMKGMTMLGGGATRSFRPSLEQEFDPGVADVDIALRWHKSPRVVP
jgi:hypothetical protein